MSLDNLKTLAANLPEPYKTNAEALIGRMEEVIEGIGDEPIRWKPSLLKLVQGTTDRTTIPKGTAIGDFVLGENKVERPLKTILLRIWEGRQFWSPDPNESKLLCSSPDAKLGYTGVYCNQCPHAKFDEVARKSECGKTQNIIAITADLSDIFQATFAKTNYKVGLDLKTKATQAKVPAYRRVYALTSETNKQYKNVENYALEILSETDRVTQDALIPFLKELFDIVSAERKESVDSFHRITLERRSQQPALPAPEAGESSGTVVLEGEPTPQEDSELAKKYSV